jgi:hypothetical protein
MITRLVTLELQGGELVEIDPDSRIVSPELPDDTAAPGETPDGTSIDEESQSN